MTVILAWMDSDSACAYSDDERLLGFIVKAASEWIAFDAIHPNEDETGMRLLQVYFDLLGSQSRRSNAKSARTFLQVRVHSNRDLVS